MAGHRHTASVSQNHKAHLANAYNELGKELSSTKIRVVGNYTLGKVIGEGAYGKVRLGTHRLTSTRVAIKQVPKGMSSSLTREIHHHRQLHHPHVTQMYEVIATESHIWIVTELCCGGELFDYLVEKGRLEEDEARVLVGQLCLAVAYLHEKGIVHRDLKLENVLLDERCRIKLGDFGFTREFERGTFMETFCGTTGYAAPEMLQGIKYHGPEVDIWSLGVILYCLLTGTLPFDDDDESVMRNKIIKGDFKDPEWLSDESRDLIKKILQKDPAKRLGIPQILSHPWFTAPRSDSAFPPSPSPLLPEPPTTEQTLEYSAPSDAGPSSAATTTSYATASSSFTNSDLLSPGDILDTPKPDDYPSSRRTPSELTIKPPSELETADDNTDQLTDDHPPIVRSNSKPPPASSLRTPVRTKRRSVSSNLSDPASPTTEKTTPLPRQDFTSLLNTPAPIIFSTGLERNLLNSLSTLGLDTAQIVHSVLSDACDAAGAVWWMLKRKAEKKAAEAEEATMILKQDTDKEKDGWRRGVSVSIQTDLPQGLSLARSAPQLAFVPPTPTFPPRPQTPTKSRSPTRPMLSPAGSLRDREKEKEKEKGRKARSGSVSIMQRATTALEAAGLVRKKSNEVVRDDKDREREKSKESERRIGSGVDEPRSSHGSTGSSSRLTKSPHVRPLKDHVPPPSQPPGTPPQAALDTRGSGLQGSPWVLTDRLGASPPPPSSDSHVPTSADSIPSLSLTGGSVSEVSVPRHRASLLTAFRLWFHEERKGKQRKDPSGLSSARGHGRVTPGSSSFGSVKRRGSGSGQMASRGGSGGGGGGHRSKRASTSSRRSSSVNSRRSSGTSAQVLLLDSPHMIEQLPTRRSIGSRTPNSDLGEHSSRPSSVHSLSMPRHRKSPSASSAGSAQQFRAASPLQKHHHHHHQSHYHKRAGSSSSSTRVVRQMQPTTSSSSRHHRSNSTTSSVHSPPSSRPTSFYEEPESMVPRTASPYRKRTDSGGTTFVAQKKQAPFASPAAIGRYSSWKKSWGLEPPGWQSRSTHIPVEVIVMSSPPDGVTGIRDVFSGRQSLSVAGDESDWVDEDDDVPAFAGGLGQGTTTTTTTTATTMTTPVASSSTSASVVSNVDATVTLAPAPKGHRSKRANRNTGGNTNATAGRQKAGHATVERVGPIPSESVYDATETRGGRRQLPSGRSGPAFKHAIQEEDEGEEE